MIEKFINRQFSLAAFRLRSFEPHTLVENQGFDARLRQAVASKALPEFCIESLKIWQICYGVLFVSEAIIAWLMALPIGSFRFFGGKPEAVSTRYQPDPLMGKRGGV